LLIFEGFSSEEFNPIIILLALFFVVVIANLPSEGILKLISGIRGRHKTSRPIRVTKLSEKISEAEKVRREEERRQKLMEKQEALKKKMGKIREEMEKVGSHE